MQTRRDQVAVSGSARSRSGCSPACGVESCQVLGSDLSNGSANRFSQMGLGSLNDRGRDAVHPRCQIHTGCVLSPGCRSEGSNGMDVVDMTGDQPDLDIHFPAASATHPWRGRSAFSQRFGNSPVSTELLCPSRPLGIANISIA
jgi:hypothetical protein